MKATAITAAALAALLAACSPKPETPAGNAQPPAATTTTTAPAPAPAAQAPSDAPAGDYKLDKSHASLNFRVDHLGFSHYTARFTGVDATLRFDPQHPEAQSVTATIDARSVQTNYPEPQKLDFDAQVERQFLDAEHHPTITFRSTRIEPTSPRTARVTGDLTLRGVTKPVTLEATFNGGYAAIPMDPGGSRIGFSARGVIRRSDFGITFGLPAPGTTMGVGDPIEVIIEAEFTRPKPAS